MTKLVTIGVPVYKRLDYLPHVLRIVQEQDYPAIDLLVSDNGMNGTKVRDLVAAHYTRPFRFRQNPATVPISCHFNQLIAEATGEYFVLLADDDEISANYVSELAGTLDACPGASVAIARQEIINEAGAVIRQSTGPRHALLSGADFISAAWHTCEYRYECFATFLARTERLRACEGYPEFERGTHNDDALLIKLCLNSQVVLNTLCAFRWRVYETSLGWSLDIGDLAKDSRQFLAFLDSDPRLREFAAHSPDVWKELKRHLVKMTWQTYLERWDGLYRKRLPRRAWVRAGFDLPFIPGYYAGVAAAFADAGRSAVVAGARRALRLRHDPANQ
jgi:glycosyltransferase involved in cell wall biosynthesis